MSTAPITIKDYHSQIQPNWCHGCGDFTIWSALKLALVELQIPPTDVLLAFDIGCNGNMSDKLKGYRIHGLHGRVLPLAMGAKIANPDLTVIAIGGDGGTYSEGINHFIHALRGDVPFTFICHDNGNYGLTKGQASSTTHQDVPMTSNPDGNPGKTLHPLDLALSLRPSFMAQGFSGELQEMKTLMMDAIKHQQANKGFGFLNILQSCPTYNKETTEEWYKEHTEALGDDYDSTNLDHARKAIANTEDHIPRGIIYTDPNPMSYFQRLPHRTPHTSLVPEVTQERSIRGIQDRFR